MAKKTETTKSKSTKATGKTVTDKVKSQEPKPDTLLANEPLETETASDMESKEALAFRRGDVIPVRKGDVSLNVTYKAFTSVYKAQGYTIVEQKPKS